MQYPFRNQQQLIDLLGITAEQAADFTPHGFLFIIERLEQLSRADKSVKGLLTAERSAYRHAFSEVKSARPFAVPELEVRPINWRDVFFAMRVRKALAA